MLDIELALLRRYPENIFPDTSELQYRLFKAESVNDKQAALTIKNLIKKTEKDWKLSYESDNNGWIDCDELLCLCETLLSRIQAYRDYHTALKFNISWGDYFSNLEPFEGELFNDDLFLFEAPSLFCDITKIVRYLKDFNAGTSRLVGFQII